MLLHRYFRPDTSVEHDTSVENWSEERKERSFLQPTGVDVVVGRGTGTEGWDTSSHHRIDEAGQEDEDESVRDMQKHEALVMGCNERGVDENMPRQRQVISRMRRLQEHVEFELLVPMHEADAVQPDAETLHALGDISDVLERYGDLLMSSAPNLE